MLVPAHAAACHVCAPTPGTNVAATNCAVGTTQLTSPTSVDADPQPSDLTTCTCSGPGLLTGAPSVFCNSSANRRSSGANSYPPAFCMARPNTSASASFGRTFE